jgi:uncharacterized repeat protein (TIGR01451 family)
MSARTILLAGIGAAVMICGLGERTEAVEFATAKSYTVGTGPTAAVAGDFNGDGKLDLAVVNKGSGNVSVLLGYGDGTFHSAVNFEAGIAAPGSIFVGDFNGDGKLDMAVFTAGNATANVPGAVSVLLGNGDGTFQAAKVTSLTIYTTQVGVGDFNGDKKADLVMSEFNTAFTLSILAGNGDGTFQTAMPLTNPVSCADGVAVVGCRVFAAADFDKNGKMDLVVAGDGGLQLLLGRGDGTFRNGVTVTVADGYSVGSVSTADLNGDGATDLIVLSTTEKCEVFNCQVTLHYSVFLGNGNGSFGAEQIFATGSSSRNEFGFGGNDGIRDILAADFDGDGKLDIVDRHEVKTSSFPGAPSVATMEVRLGRGDGTFAPPIGFPDPGTIGLAVDFNADKLADVVVIGTSNDFDVLLNDSPTNGADLALTQAGATPEPVGVGQNLTYGAIVLNEGPENATGVVYQDTLPTGVTYVSAASTLGSCSAGNGIVTCNIGTLAKAASAQVTIVVKPTALGTVSNGMSVTGNEPDGNAANNSASQTSTVSAVYTLKVKKAGTGTGTVSARVGVGAGINCGSACVEMYLTGTTVTLTASADSNSTFDSWGGDCAGSQCSLTMDGDKTITATFATQPDFQVSPSAVNLAMALGGQTSEPLNFPAVGGFTGMIAVTCSVSGPAPMPTCAVSPSSVAAGSSATLTVSGPIIRAALQRDVKGGVGMTGAACLPLLLMAPLLGMGFNKKRSRKWLACMLVLAASVLPVACGGGKLSKQTAQNYVVTVNAQAGAISHVVSVNVTVD